MIENLVQRRLIAASLGAVLDKAVVEHSNAVTQEHQLTSRLAQALEYAAPVVTEATQYEMKVTVQEIPDKGPGSLEKKLGADLYVAIQVDDNRRVQSKGFLVQSKRWGFADPRLESQCEAMLWRSKASYVWYYSKRGLRIARASSVVGSPQGERASVPHVRSADRVFDAILKCREGDVHLGIPPHGSEPGALRGSIADMLRGLSVGSAATLTLTRQT